MPYLEYATLLKDAAVFVREASQAGEVLVLASTRGAADDLVRFHCGDVAGVHRFTINRLVATLSASPLAERGFVPVNSLGVEALAARAVQACRGRLPYLEPVATSPGFARALARTILDLRLHQPPADALGPTGLSGPDVALLLKTYEELLRENRFADFPALMRLAQSQIGSHPLTGIPLLLLDVPVHTTLAADFIENLRAASPSTKVFVHTADEATRSRVPQAPSRNLVQNSTQVADSTVGPASGRSRVDITGDAYFPQGRLPLLPAVSPLLSTPPPHSTLSTLRANLFASSVTATDTIDNSFDFFSAAGDGLECTEIARRIQELSPQVAFDEIAILLRNPERYQPLLEEAFTRAQVPFYFTHGAVRPDPTGRAFLALLACKAEGYTATRFAEYLSFGQTPPIERPRAMAAGAGVFGTEDDLLTREATDNEADEVDSATPATPGAWEKLIVDASVVGGRDRWDTRLRGLEQQFLMKLGRIEDGDEANRGYLQRQIELLRNLQQMALPAIERMDAMPRQATWGEWLEHLTDLAQLTLRRPESVLLALNELWPMSEVGPVGMDEVFLVLAGRLRFLRRTPNGRRYGQVWIGTIEEARGQSFRAVFLPGLAEGMFPRKAFEDPLLLDNQRRALDAKLPKRDDRVAQERLRLHIASAVAADAIVVSYPRMDVVQNRPRVPSFYAMEVVRAAEGRLPELREFERRAARGALTRLGWPAPEDPQRSVDALEFDIASLLAATKSGVRGSARYLLSLNPHLARGLRSRHLRWTRKWTYADGLKLTDSKLLEPYRLRNRPWSASTLQLFAACPYKFVLHGIHHLRPREEPVPLEEMDALIRGSLFHQVQFEIFQRLQSGRRPDAIANEVLDKVAKEYADKLAPAIPRVWQGEVEDLRADLQGWIRRMPDDMQNWQPAYSEFSFGLPLSDGGRDSRSSSSPATIEGGYQLRGSIDWIETNEDASLLRITDHKTGKPPREIPRHVGRGAVLQPLLYAAAANAVLGIDVKFSRLHYCTQRGTYRVIDFAITDEARTKLDEALSHIDEAIAKGLLPAAPAADACKYCDFTSVCGRREEERTRRKPPLTQLELLRAMP